MDTNVVAYFVLDGPRTPEVERLRDVSKPWIVPPVFPHELLNVLARYIRLGRLTRDAAIRAYRQGRSLVEVDERPPDPVDVLRLCEQSGCSSWDAQFVELSRRLNLPPVTLDAGILAAYTDLALSVETYLRMNPSR